MISLTAIHEEKITRFQRNQYIISVSDLKNKSSIGHEDFQNENHITIETIKRLYPQASIETVARILLISIQTKLQNGEKRFLLSFTDETECESMDLLNGLFMVLQLETTTEEHQKNVEVLHTYANKWTKGLCQIEEKYHYIDNTLKNLRATIHKQS